MKYPCDVTIYKLIDPRTMRCRYYGQTSDPVGRFRGHRKPKFVKTNKRLFRWLLGLKKQNRAVIIECLEVVRRASKSDTRHIDIEAQYIKRGRRSGEQLFNVLIGMSHTKKTRANISKGQFRRFRLHPVSQLTKKRLSKFRVMFCKHHRKYAIKQAKLMRAAAKKDSRFIAKISAGVRRAYANTDLAERISKSHIGKKHSRATKQKMARARKRWWRNRERGGIE
jgi:hypothetical protein